ncbi:DUF2071 domain-containing protein [Bremerella cremea]|uniref:DUF2071 domain-containing protein n=1 Tax=Blastopirellula marina TaxID=124 RepID=A0A2S8F8S5_9BACT|nr:MULTISPECIES: DUF2071 domain-containing protein [Pirellulaceae]PQO28568.1 hypothetical protein C5Y83_28605 [Blastopirellula marina]RCS41938.1 DUF2071 domain-containing protein [Bremerella cremea]
MIDRIVPTRRPSGRIRGYQQWRSLLFLHWPVPVATLRRLVPDSLEIDTYDGVAYIGVVPFSMFGVRPGWWPEAWAFNFLETNVRTYVVRDGKPGVYFFSLDAANGLAVWAARQFWGLPYFHAKMSLEASSDEVRYQTVRRQGGAKHRVRYRIGEALPPSDPDSLEFFFLERYLLFVERKGKLFSGQVHHTPYPAHTAELLEIEDSLLAAAGIDDYAQTPSFAHYSPGVNVEIYDLQQIF